MWKHSYLQVPRSELPSAKTYSAFSKPCTDLKDGWCNIPNKQLPGASEQMIVAYHIEDPIYAYKSPLNPNLGKTEMGARLLSGWSRVLDRCTINNGIRPDISRLGGYEIIYGLAFDKVTPDDIDANCDTVHRDYEECRWHDCGLPRTVSPQPFDVQMTVAIFVR